MNITALAQEWIRNGYAFRLSPSEASISPTWINHAVDRIVHRITSTQSSDLLIENTHSLQTELHNVGQSLQEYYSAKMKAAMIARDCLGKAVKELPEVNFNNLIWSIPNPYSYVDDRLLCALGTSQILKETGESWSHLCAHVRNDFILRSMYGQFVCRLAAYARIDARVGCNTFFNGSSYTLKTSNRMYNLIRLLIVVGATLIGAAIGWRFANSNEPANAALIGALSFWFSFSLTTAGSRRDERMRNSLLDDIRPIVALENAISSSESEIELAQCAELSKHLFLNGYIEVKHIAGIISQPSKQPN